MLRNLFLIILLICFTVSFSQEKNWNLRKNSNEILVYTRIDNKTDLIESKVIAIIKTDMESVVNKITDIEGYNTWIADLETSKTLKTINKNESYTYVEVKVPWPFDNRDIVSYQKISYSENMVVISTESRPNFIPEKDGIVRQIKANSSWTFVKLSDGSIKVKYQFIADPGLNIPNWIINMFIVDSPYKTMENLRKSLENE